MKGQKNGDGNEMGMRYFSEKLRQFKEAPKNICINFTRFTYGCRKRL